MTIILLLTPLCCFAATQTTTAIPAASENTREVDFWIGALVGVPLFILLSKHFRKNVRIGMGVVFGITLTLIAVSCWHDPAHVRYRGGFSLLWIALVIIINYFTNKYYKKGDFSEDIHLPNIAADE